MMKKNFESKWKRNFGKKIWKTIKEDIQLITYIGQTCIIDSLRKYN